MFDIKSLKYPKWSSFTHSTIHSVTIETDENGEKLWEYDFINNSKLYVIDENYLLQQGRRANKIINTRHLTQAFLDIYLEESEYFLSIFHVFDGSQILFGAGKLIYILFKKKGEILFCEIIIQKKIRY